MAIFNSYVSLPEGKSRDFLGSIPRFRGEKPWKTRASWVGGSHRPSARLGQARPRPQPAQAAQKKLEDPKDVPCTGRVSHLKWIVEPTNIWVWINTLY